MAETWQKTNVWVAEKCRKPKFAWQKAKICVAENVAESKHLRGRTQTRRWMARERRRACYSVVSSIKDILGESFIEDDADDQQKGDRNAMSDSKQK